ncbi:Alpha/Beta hydrolase protein [Radiomyces spectabilis]|uniref:Alpha/Beta hydrolase protein n=1 Tax=Radiomyces spectabilis TaxID=64574 RepID=UPI00221EBE6A|nr:Alpha/Beta hydrolase protein [Radiomyces spectabilis]KAI8393751.1 Alpha/Beta hydrolase protein [Radiomyces spectabilis]
MVQTKPFGAWPSPVTVESLTVGKPATDVCVDPTTQCVYWCEVIPAEEGRGQIFSQSLRGPSSPKPLLPKGYSCVSRVHEYGGGSFKVHKGLLVFSNDTDHRLHKIDLTRDSLTITPLTPENKLLRYADLDITDEYIVCVREEHFENEEPKDVVNTLVAIDLQGQQPVQIIAQGNDFYSTPRVSPDGKHLAYITWVHSNMPWDFTRLYYASIHYNAGKLTLDSDDWIAGKTVDESIVECKFGVDNTLYFASDRSGFWNIYRFHQDEIQLVLEKPLSQEFAGPAWRFNDSSFIPSQTDASKLYCINKSKLAVIDVSSRKMTDIPTNFEHFDQLRTFVLDGQEYLVANAASTTASVELVALNVDTNDVSVLKPSSGLSLDPSYISIGKEIEFPTTDNKISYCYFYEPKNPEYVGEGQPPLRVLSHGGPTSQSDNAYSLAIQYWTTRGFAVADVNYSGSTGYGREYRNRLQKNWGIMDVDDCCNAALYLAEKGLVDRNKLAIEGGSAGGFTTLASVAFRNVFSAGCCLYGISDITLLAKETHKFESRYPDQLIGEYPKDEQVYIDRSPLFKADQIKCPVIFFQGAEDKVVPPSQSEIMVEAMKKKGVPVAYVKYEGEAHGFRRAENIKRTMELEQWFYGQIFGFPVEGIEGVEIYNFSPSQ